MKAASSVPVWVKLTPNTADILELGLAAQRGGADAVVAINTLKAMAIDIETGYPILGNRFGGLSGRAIKPVAVRAVYDLAYRLEIPVIGVGGISSWEDAVEMREEQAESVYGSCENSNNDGDSGLTEYYQPLKRIERRR